MCRWHANERRPSRQARLRGRRPLLCSAARGAVRNAKQIKARSKKDRASQKQRSDFLAAPVHKAPPGRQKSECEFCLFGGVFLRSVCRAVCRGGRLCAACRCLACWLLRPVPRRFFPAAALAAVCETFRRCARVLHLCFRPACSLPLLRPACASCRLPLLCLACAAPGPACRLSAVRRERRIFAAFSREAQGGIFPFSAVFRRFVPDLRAAFLPPLRRLLRLFVWPALPLPAVRFVCAVLFCFGCLFACSALFARVFSLVFLPFPA